MEEIKKLKEELQQEKDGRCADLDELEKENEILREKLDTGTEQHMADTQKLNKFYMKTKEENKKLAEELNKLKNQ